MRLAAFAAMSAVLLGGCASLGPTRLAIDRSDYANHLRETNKEQLLLNLVAMRYGDAPLFLEVSSVISQYTREGQLSGSLPISPPAGDAEGVVGASVLLRESPTITYTPLAGDRFARSLLSPLPPASLLAMIEAGWSAGALFRIAVRSINGVRNGSRNPLFADDGDPAFDEVVVALARLQRSRAIVFHVERGAEGRYQAEVTISPELDDETRTDLALLVRSLRLPGDARRPLTITFGSDQTAPRQRAIGSRSMFEIFAEMSQGVEIPAAERAGRATPSAYGVEGAEPLIAIHSGSERPADAHAAVRYRGHWFWIAGDDHASKRMFLIAQILLSLNDTSAGANAPLVTIPTG